MALKINDKAGINATFQALPELKEVHIAPNGDHHFSKDYFELKEGITSLLADSAELVMTPKEIKAAEPLA